MFFDIRYELKFSNILKVGDSPFEKVWEGESVKHTGYTGGKCLPRVWKNVIGLNAVFSPGFCIDGYNFYFPRHAFKSQTEAMNLAKILASEADTLEPNEILK